MAPKTTADNIRSEAGVGSVRNIYKGPHKGITKRPTEGSRIDEITSADIGKSSRTEKPMANMDFGRGPEGER